MSPALPGPGWPHERMPSVVHPAEPAGARIRPPIGEEWIDAP